MTDLTYSLCLIGIVVFIAVLCALGFWAVVIDRNRGLFGDALPRRNDDERYL